MLVLTIHKASRILRTMPGHLTDDTPNMDLRVQDICGVVLPATLRARDAEILIAHACGLSGVDIATRYKLSESAVSRLISRHRDLANSLRTHYAALQRLQVERAEALGIDAICESLSHLPRLKSAAQIASLVAVVRELRALRHGDAGGDGEGNGRAITPGAFDADQAARIVANLGAQCGAKSD